MHSDYVFCPVCGEAIYPECVNNDDLPNKAFSFKCIYCGSNEYIYSSSADFYDAKREAIERFNARFNICKKEK